MITEEELIKLAQLAPQVEAKTIAEEKAKFTSPSEFVLAVDLKRGRNLVFGAIIHEAYLLYTNHPVSKEMFMLHIGKMFKRVNNDYKLNMKAITLLERAKEKQHEKEKNKKK